MRERMARDDTTRSARGMVPRRLRLSGAGRTGWAQLVLVAVLTLAGTAPSAGQSGYNTTAVVVTRSECIEVPGCVTEFKPAVDVPARGRVTARFDCGPDHPNLGGWDLGQHEHISVELIAINRTSVTVAGTNHDATNGQFAVFLGCSTAPNAVGAILKSRHLAPTGWTGVQLR